MGWTGLALGASELSGERMARVRRCCSRAEVSDGASESETDRQ